MNTPTAREKIDQWIKKNKILVFMKGTPEMPQCGFSASTVACFHELNVPFTAVDVLADPEIRDEIKQYSNWPTIPQVYINGQFVGGCDITRDMHNSGELKKLIEAC